MPLARIRALVTVEPILFFFSLIGGLSDTTNNHLLYRKVCIIEYHNETLCDIVVAGLEANGTKELVVQSITSRWQFYLSAVYTLPAIVCTTVYGSWSDHFSRKKPLLFPIIGTILSVTGYLVCSIFMEAPVVYLLISALIYGLSGGWVTLLMASFTYMSQVSSRENRTSRVAILEALIQIGAAVSSFLSGIILEAVGFVVIYSLCIGVFSLVLIYTAVWILEIKPPQRPSAREVTGNDSTREEGKALVGDTDPARRSWLSLRHVWDTLVIGLKKREHMKRAYLMVQFVCVFLVTWLTAESIVYLYLRHSPLNFTPQLYGYYVGTYTLVTGVTMLIAVPLLKKVAHVGDPTLMVIGTVGTIGGKLILAFSVHPWTIFLGIGVACMDKAPIAGLRGLMSVMVGDGEHGKLFAMIACLENLGGLFRYIVFNFWMYPASLDVFPGFSYVLAAVLQLLPLGCFIWLGCSLRRRKNVAAEREPLIKHVPEDFAQTEPNTDTD